MTRQVKVHCIQGRRCLCFRNTFLIIRKGSLPEGTKSAKREQKALSGRENRWTTHINHQVSKTLVDEYGKDSRFVLEDLAGVRFDEDDLSKNSRYGNRKNMLLPGLSW